MRITRMRTSDSNNNNNDGNDDNNNNNNNNNNDEMTRTTKTWDRDTKIRKKMRTMRDDNDEG